jgi:hypothetical protein
MLHKLNQQYEELIPLRLFILINAAAFLTGCVSVKIPERLPENTTLNINISLYKSNAGHSNMLDQTTDATLPINALGSEYWVAPSE